jgi:hypothetical protein
VLTDDVRALPEQRPSGAAPSSVDGPSASEQSVRRLSELVLGASSLADRLQRVPGHDPARQARVEQLRGFVAWAQNAIDRAVTDDAYAQAVVGGRQAARRTRV